MLIPVKPKSSFLVHVISITTSFNSVTNILILQILTTIWVSHSLYQDLSYKPVNMFPNKRERQLIFFSQKQTMLIFRSILSSSCSITLFSYGSEIYGFENLDIIEKVHNEFLRKLLKARKSTPLYMLYGEFGRYPISVQIKSRMIQFWSKLLVNTNKISYKIYFYMLNLPNIRFKWLSEIGSILDSVGLSNFWYPNVPVPLNLHKLVKQTLIDQYNQNWNTLVNSSNKRKIYQLGKISIG